MAKDKRQEEELDLNVAYSRTERYIEENQKPIGIILAAVLILVAGYFAYTKIYLKNMEQDAQSQIFMAQLYFEQDSMRLALHGDGSYPGFLEIIEEYSGTNSANLAHYYTGVIYLQGGNYQQAIDHLKQFDSDDVIVSSIAKGGIGDAYMELGQAAKAIDYYVDAADDNPDEFTSPLYLFRAGLAAEETGDHQTAKKIYSRVKEQYPKSNEGREIEKYIARVEGKINE